eukprot:Sdes_comp15278_c0_seq2m4123
MLLGKISSNFFRWNSFVKFTPNFRFASKPSHVYCSTLNLPTFSFRAYSQASSPLSTTTDPSDTKKSEPKRLETKIYRALAAVFGYYSTQPQNILKAKKIYFNICTHVHQQEFHKALDIPDTYQSWFSVTVLHLYICMLRMKQGGTSLHGICQELFVVFWEDCEYRMRLAGVNSNSIVADSLKKLWDMFNGCVIAYDEGMVSSDPVLAAALWRNMLFMRGSVENVETLLIYTRREVLQIGQRDIEALIGPTSTLFGTLASAQQEKKSAERLL